MCALEDPRLLLGLKIRTHRQRRGETLKALAARSGLSISYLSEIEKGKKYPKPERLLRLARALEVPFDDLVSLQVEDELTPLKMAFSSSLLHGFPFHLFGFEREDLMALMTGDPERGSALMRAVAEIGRSYDVHVEHFLLAALRAHQHQRSNAFDELEQEAMHFRRDFGLDPNDRLDPSQLVEILADVWGMGVDEEQLRSSGELSGFRSVFSPGPPPIVHVNPRLMSSQKLFVLAREIAYQHLGLEVRASSSPWLEVESFDQVFNNFKASYFAGALLLDREQLRNDLLEAFGRSSWKADAMTDLMDKYGVTPETFLHRLTQILPAFFGLGEYYFLRFSAASTAPGEKIRLTKWLNTSRVPVPRGFGLSEHFCRRWPALGLLAAKSSHLADPRDRLVVAHKVEFMDEHLEFLEISMARPMALQPGVVSVVTVGFAVGPALRRVVRFWNDESLPRVEVNLTCERCGLGDCDRRVAPASILEERRSIEQKELVLRDLLVGSRG